MSDTPLKPPQPGVRFSTDAWLALMVVGIVMLMILPLPAMMMDLLLAVSISLSLLLLLVSLYLRRPLEFSVFPTVLLLSTLLRLALNVASTRLVLLHGHEGTRAAGKIIETFGHFVVGGNFVVGGIVFLILIIINFVVITKGAGRVAEVAARFTLDAMPGKQMAIDAELSSGAINDEEAKKRRREIEHEADFYGAMDGSSKFVRGDAVAGLIITIINIVGGLIIGVSQQSLPLGVAARTYALLTIGDGLVSQIPALMVSTAAGIIVTRAASDTGLSEELTAQLMRHQRTFQIIALMLFAMGCIPGMPTLILFGLSALAFLMSRQQLPEKVPETTSAAPETTETPEMLREMLPVDTLELELGYALVRLVEKDLLQRIKAIRRQFATDLGFIVPPVRIRDNLRLEPELYRVLLRGVEIGRGRLMSDRLMAMSPGEVSEQIAGIPGVEPAFGMDAVWIESGDRTRAENAGYTVVDCSTVVATHITEIIRRHAAELLGRQEAQELLEVVGRRSPKLVEDLIPTILSQSEVVRVLRLLLAEEISIRDLATILETLAEEAPRIKDAFLLAEVVRSRLSHAICQKVSDTDGRLHAVLLDSATEKHLRERLVQSERGQVLALDLNQSRLLINRLQTMAANSPIAPLMIVAPDLRRACAELLRRFVPQLNVLSHHEVGARTEVRTIGTLSLLEAGHDRRMGNALPQGAFPIKGPALNAGAPAAL
jgi:flagellar biosynthesis protein FlhA